MVAARLIVVTTRPALSSLRRSAASRWIWESTTTRAGVKATRKSPRARVGSLGALGMGTGHDTHGTHPSTARGHAPQASTARPPYHPRTAVQLVHL